MILVKTLLKQGKHSFYTMIFVASWASCACCIMDSGELCKADKVNDGKAVLQKACLMLQSCECQVQGCDSYGNQRGITRAAHQRVAESQHPATSHLVYSGGTW